MRCRLGTYHKWHRLGVRSWENVLLRAQGTLPEGEGVELPDRFHAVLELMGVETGRSGCFYHFAPTGAGLEGVSLIPMSEDCFHRTLFVCEWVGPRLLDGYWGLRKHGGYVSAYPITAEERDGVSDG